MWLYRCYLAYFVCGSCPWMQLMKLPRRIVSSFQKCCMVNLNSIIGDIDPISKSCWGWHWVCKLSEMHNSSDKAIKLILAGAYEWYRMLLHDGKCHIVVLGGWWRTGFMKCRGTCLGPQTYLNTNCDQCYKSNRKNQMALNLAFACLHDA